MKQNTEANVAAYTEGNQLGTNRTAVLKESAIKPWQIKRNKQEKFDKLAPYIIAEEALKLITGAYEVVFEGKEKPNSEDNKGVGNSIGKKNSSSMEEVREKMKK